MNRYLNTDLELRAPFDLKRMQELLDGPQLDGICLTEYPPGEWFTNFETRPHRAPEEAICLMLDVLESPDGEALDIWNRCTSRDINIGFDSGFAPFSFNRSISPETLGRMAKAGIGLIVTIYRVEPRAKKKKMTTRSFPPGT